MLLFLNLKAFASSVFTLDTSITKTHTGVANTSDTISMTTNGTNRIAKLSIMNTATVSSISGCGTWTQNQSASDGTRDLYIYTAPESATQSSCTVTVNFSSSSSYAFILDTFYYTSTSTLPAVDTSNSTGSLSGTAPSATMNTKLNNSTVTATLMGTAGSTPTITAGTGFTIDNTVTMNGGTSAMATEHSNTITLMPSVVTMAFNSTQSLSSGAIIQGIDFQGQYIITLINNANINNANIK